MPTYLNKNIADATLETMQSIHASSASLALDSSDSTGRDPG